MGVFYEETRESQEELLPVIHEVPLVKQGMGGLELLVVAQAVRVRVVRRMRRGLVGMW